MEHSKKAEKIYREIEKDLRGNMGKIIAIDAESGEYFIGNNTIEAYEKGTAKHPHAEFYFKRIGAETAYG